MRNPMTLTVPAILLISATWVAWWSGSESGGLARAQALLQPNALLEAADASDSEGPRQVLQSLSSDDRTVLPIGMSATGARIWALVNREDAVGNLHYETAQGGTTKDGKARDADTPKTRIVLVGRDARAADVVARTVQWFVRSQQANEFREHVVLSAVVDPQEGESSAGDIRFPPPADAYLAVPERGAQYLWRWLGMHAADLVVEVRFGPSASWFTPPEAEIPRPLAARLRPAVAGQETELAAAVSRHEVGGMGRIPGLRCTAGGPEFLLDLLTALREVPLPEISPAQRELQRRAARSPREVAEQLARRYGHDASQFSYIPALAMIGRMRLGEAEQSTAALQDVQRLLAPMLEASQQAAPRSGSGLAGHLVFADVAARLDPAHRESWIRAARLAGDLARTPAGGPRAEPPFHNQMSDAVFMNGPLLARLGALTGDASYYEVCLSHLRFIRGLCLREDGLYRHSPQNEAAWGRGNGFPALGLALCLSDWPPDRKDHEQVLQMFQAHLRSLAAHQDLYGCWHQVIDRPETYREYTATAMITFAAARGVRRGWLERDSFDALIRRGWQAVCLRTSDEWVLVDVCEGTGKQRTLEDYFLRKAILGPDDRGGAMGLMLATEMMDYDRAFPGEHPQGEYE